ncbi:unnamed protein product [Withania somnifera]
MASMQCFREEDKELEYYTTYGNQRPTNYSNAAYEKSYYEKERCYETKPGMMGYGANHGTNSCGPMGHGKLGHNAHGTMGYGTGHNTNHGMGYGHNTHSHEYGNHHMHKPGPNGLGMGLGLGIGTPLGHVMGFGKTHEGHGGYGMGSSGCTTYRKQHLRRKGMGGYGSGSDSSDDERYC